MKLFSFVQNLLGISRFEQTTKTSPIQVPKQLSLFPPESLDVIWKRLRQNFFPEHPTLDDYRIVWSNRRQTSCLASCNAERRCVRVAKTMQLPESLPYLEPLLYHEMCHAVLGRPKVRRGRRQVHGKDFKALEKRHPGITALNKWIASGGWRQATRRIDH